MSKLWQYADCLQLSTMKWSSKGTFWTLYTNLYFIMNYKIEKLKAVRIVCLNFKNSSLQHCKAESWTL